MKRVLVSILAVLCGSQIQAADQPNVLIIMADDCTHNDLPLYGGVNAVTPNIDQFASQGMTFNRAYLCEAMCQPCRAALYTGQFPMRNGCAWNHSACRRETKSLPHLLRPAGYRVGIAGKVHVTPDDVFPFEHVAGFDPNCVRNPTQDCTTSGVSDFMTQDDQPFCLVIALVEPHVPWVMGDPSQYPPQEIQLPDNLADTRRTREDFGRYLAEITYMDNQVGQILETLERSGRSDDTLVLFTSEQGSQFPGCKWTNWDTGLHTALVARWPGHIDAGVRTDAIVQYVDVAPTLLDVADRNVPADITLDGTSFLPVLTGDSSEHRKYAYGTHNNIPEGPAYPIRTVTNGTYRYIRNLLPEEMYIEKHLMGHQGNGDLNNPYWATWVGQSWNNEKTYSLVKRYTYRPGEQLFRTSEDPYELKNLAGDPQYAANQKELSDELDRWLAEQDDPGIPQDTMDVFQAAREGRHRFGAKPATDAN